ncbi:B3 domain-containing protein [Rhynchospora pubera]|uniref:B3 domain-containing protein n=1 Tax=Rhynchospora pubera TaxID=906938 RepID=A0AAV8HM45_9POAL|nr:B3 domain-containing protein [Rhynchospora pubera]
MAMAAVSSYEELRQKKLEENKRKIEELKLSHISASLRKAVDTPKRSSAKLGKRKAPEPPVTARRSARVASLPERPKYQDAGFDIIPRLRRGSSKRKGLDERVYATYEEREYAMEKAAELEESLGSDFPIFLKSMLQSHVTGGFWLGLPVGFCRTHLPKKDSDTYLLDEDGVKSKTLYLASKRGLSGGWRGFAIKHELVDGDAVVFQLIAPTTFKVYIVRASGYHDK